MLLKWKADDVTTDTPPLPHLHQSPPPPRPACKCPRCDRVVLKQMRELMQVRAQRLDSLCASQLAAQEASGVMAAAMLRKQGTMRQVAVWEMEVGDMMREMALVVEEGKLGL